MSPRVLSRVLLSVLAGALCGVVVACGVVVLGSDRGGLGDDARVAVERPAPGEPTRPHDGPAGRRARAVLRQWDAARARAWTNGDPVALARLYTAGSVAGERDVSMLRAWADRGARVTDLTTQVLRLQVLADGRHRLVLVVTDRVARVGVTGVRPPTLPRDRASTRRIVLVRVADRWRVESVSPARPGRS